MGRYVTLELTHDEDRALRELATEHEMSEDGVLRLALRYYQVGHRRLLAGETVVWSGDAKRLEAFMGPLK